MFWHKYRKYKYLPLHKAIIEGDKVEPKNGSLLQKDWLGFTGYDLLRLLQGRVKYSISAPPICKEDKILAQTPKEYEKLLQIRYLPSLIFDQYKILAYITNKCQKALKRNDITTNQRWLGCYFNKEITEYLVPDISVRWIDDLIGYGVFAEKDLPIKTYIGEYAGRLRKSKGRADNRNSYCFEYLIGAEKETAYTIDAQDEGNYTRFLNHSNTGNCDPSLIYHNLIMKVVFYTNKAVKKGEELTYDYGSDYWAMREEPLPR